MGGAREILIEGERDVKIDGGEAQIGEINRGGVTSEAMKMRTRMIMI